MNGASLLPEGRRGKKDEVYDAVPSMIFSNACCTPSPDARVIDGLSDLRLILSIGPAMSLRTSCWLLPQEGILGIAAANLAHSSSP